MSSFLRYRKREAADPFAMRVTRGPVAENPRGDFVLYWAESARRMQSNLALDFAIARANELGLPVVVCEEPDLSSDRRFAFAMDGIRDNARQAEQLGLRYVAGATTELRRRARIIVTDDHPTIAKPDATFLVDGNGILPVRAFEKEQYSAKFLRDRAHRMFLSMWASPPAIEARHQFRGEIDDPELPASSNDASVRPVPQRGGHTAAVERLEAFIASGLPGYAEGRNKSPRHVSGLSPYLHFGHIGIHEVAERILESDAPKEDVDAFLEEAIIRRELSFNLCFYRRDYDSLGALPDWAKKTLDAHRDDRRKRDADDEVWELANRQLLACGTIHGYLRMLWGKKLIEWSSTPEKAHRAMVDLHDKYALDGRDPNTHAGILWCFGKHDRPWFPERPVFGTIRYMSSASTAKKVRLREIEELVRRVEDSDGAGSSSTS